MKLIELAEEHNLDQELLKEVCEEDLSIPLPDDMATDLQDEQVRRILACDGLETVDGEAFAPIIDAGFIQKRKRSQAAKKAAATRKRKEEEKAAQKQVRKQAEIEAERVKHEEALRKRELEEEARRRLEEVEEAQRESDEETRRIAEEEARRIAEEEVVRREEGARKVAAGLAKAAEEKVEARQAKDAKAEAEARLVAAHAGDAPSSVSPREAEAMDEAEAVAEVVDTAAEAEAIAEADATAAAEAEAIAEADATAQAETEATAEAEAEAVPAEAPAPAATEAPPAASAAEAPPKPVEGPKSKLGSKLASLAKATAEKADHSTKDKDVKELRAIDAKAGSLTGSTGDDVQLSDEDRRKIIQDNIRKNLAMQQRVKEAKTADRRRGFKPIDRRTTPGPGGPGQGPAGGPGRGGPGRGAPARGGPGGRGRGRPEDVRDEKEGNLRGRRRRPLSTEEEDLSGKTEFAVSIPCTVRDFSEASGLKANVVIAKLFMAGVMANINSTMDRDQIELLASEFKKEVTIKEGTDVEEEVEALHIEENEAEMGPRAPIVTILGHVDHGKTSLLDAIRKTEITADEAGGITQHIGAYTVHTPLGLEVTFIDTPGHEAFTAMRARGAQVTDIAVIVVAADDGVMPQTIEAINHAKAAEVTIMVAMNKIDLEGADPDKVLRELAEQGLLAEDWGGEVGVIRTSATTGQGIDELLERITLESEVLELQANHMAKASGVVLEANLSEGRGVTATLLVERGTLFAGDVVLAGSGYGRVRNMVNWKGEAVAAAGPSHAVEIIGLSEMPTAGGRFHVVDNLKMAAGAADQRAHQIREKELASRNTTTSLATLFQDIAEKKKSELRLIVKADAAGSMEVLKKSIYDLGNDEVKVNLIHSGVGAISTGDVTLAEASQAVILGFHVTADGKARRQAEDRNIEIQSYTIIYQLLDDVRRGLEGLLKPEEVEKFIGSAEVLQTFKSSKWGTIAGLMVHEGNIIRGCGLRLTRGGNILHEGRVSTLRRFKEDVKDVRSGYECGLTIEKFNDVQIGDTIEFFTKEKVARTLS